MCGALCSHPNSEHAARGAAVKADARRPRGQGFGYFSALSDKISGKVKRTTAQELFVFFGLHDFRIELALVSTFMLLKTVAREPMCYWLLFALKLPL